MQSKSKPSAPEGSVDISEELEKVNEDSLFAHFNMQYDSNKSIVTPSETVFSSHQHTEHRYVTEHSFDHLFISDQSNDNFGIAATNTINIYLCIEGDHRNNNKSQKDNVIQQHNKYMFTNTLTKQFYCGPFNNDKHQAKDNNWSIFEFNDIFLNETSFPSDVFSNVIEPIIKSFTLNQSACLALYSPEKTAWNDRLQMFDVVRHILEQLDTTGLECKVSAYEINDDHVYDLLPTKDTVPSSYTEREPLKLSLNRSLHYVLDDISKIEIKSIENGLQYFEKSHDLFKSSKSSHYVYSITACNAVNGYALRPAPELRIVQLCSADPARNQSLLNMKQCIKVEKRNKTNQSKLKKSLYVPYRRHLFTKLFQKYIDGTSLFSFLFYLPPIHTHQTNKKMYLDRILSLLNYTCRRKHISQFIPFSKEHLSDSKHKPDFDTKQNESDHEDSDLEPVQSHPIIKRTLSQSTQGINSNYKALLKRNYEDFEISRQHTDKLLSHKNHTIQQLSKQVDTLRIDSDAHQQILQNTIHSLKEMNENEQGKSNKYLQQIDALHNEIKTMHQSANQMKSFLSDITNILQIDLSEHSRSLSWTDITNKISAQQFKLTQANRTIERLDSVVTKVNKSYHSDITMYKKQTVHTQQIIQQMNKEIKELRNKSTEETQQNESLSLKITEITYNNEWKMKQIHTKHQREMEELHCMVDTLSDEFCGLEDEEPGTVQLSSKVQHIQISLRDKLKKENDIHRLEMNALNHKLKQFEQFQTQNQETLEQYENIQELHQTTTELLKESNAKYNALRKENDTKQKEIEAVTNTYQSLLNQTKAYQHEYNELQSSHQQTLDEYQVMKAALNEVKTSSERNQEIIECKNKEIETLSNTIEILQNSNSELQELHQARNEEQREEQTKRTRRELQTQNVLSRFKCAMHRGLYEALKEQMKGLKSKQLQYEEHIQNIQTKEEKYLKLENDFNMQLSMINELKTNLKFKDVNKIVKGLKEDKENLENVNKQLKQQTNVYRFQSATHQKRAQSLKNDKCKFKTQVLQMLEEHAPHDSIKHILTDKKKVFNISTNARPLPDFEEIKTPKFIETEYQHLEDEIAAKDRLMKTVTIQKDKVMDDLNQWKVKYDRLYEENVQLKQNVKQSVKQSEKKQSVLKQDISKLKNEIQEMKVWIPSMIGNIYQYTQTQIGNLNTKYNTMTQQNISEYDREITALNHIIESKTKQFEELENVLSKVNTSYTTDIAIYKEQINHSEQIIQGNDGEIQELKHKIDEETKRNELLSSQMTQISENNESKIRNMNENHEKELKELNSMLDDLSKEFSSVKSSANNSPLKTDGYDSDQQLSRKVQQIKKKLQHRFAKQKSKHTLAINGLNFKIKQLWGTNKTNAGKLKQFEKIKILLEESNVKYHEIKQDNEIMKESISEFNVLVDAKQEEIETYSSLLKQIKPFQERYRQLQLSSEQIIHEYQEFKKESSQTTNHLLHDVETMNTTSNQLKISLEHRHQIIQSKNNEIEALMDRIKEISRNNESQINNIHQDYANTICDLKHEAKQIQNSNEMLQDTIKQLRGKTTDVLSQVDVYKNKIVQKDVLLAPIMIKNNRQYHQIIALKNDNSALKHEMVHYDAQITRLKECILSKFAVLDRKYAQKIDELNCTNAMVKDLRNTLQCKAKRMELKRAYDHVLCQDNDLKVKYTQTIHKLNDALQRKMTEMQSKHEAENVAIHLKLDILSRVIATKLKWCSDIICSKDIEIQDLCTMIEDESQEIDFLKKEIDRLCENRNKLREFHQQQMEEKNCKIVSFQSKYSPLIATNAEQYEEIISLKERNDALKHDIKCCDAQITKLRDCVTTKMNETDSANHMTEELKQMIKQLNDYMMVSNANTKQEHNDLKRKYNLMLRQSAVLSKLNLEIQTENNELMEAHLLFDRKYRKSQQSRHQLRHYLFYRTLIASCYHYKCNELQKEIMSLHKDQERTQSDLTAQQLKVLLLNDDIQTLRKYKEELESNKTGLMLESLEAQDTIQELIGINKKFESYTRTICNDPHHTQTITSLKEKFNSICLKMEKLQIESFDSVQNTVSLRDENMELKKENRKISREIKHLQKELQDVTSKLQRDWSLSTSCAESVQSNHGIYYDEEGNTMNLEQLKMKMEDDCMILNDAQSNIFKYTNSSIHAVNERLYVCVDQMKQLQIECSVHRNKEQRLKDVMVQIMDLSDKVTNAMRQRCDGILTLFEIRCDGVSQNVRLIKHTLDNRESEQKRLKSEHQNKIETHLYDLQFNMTITRKTFQHEMTENIKHAMHRYDEQYKQTQSMVSKAFELTVERSKQSLYAKNAKIYELESLLFEKRDQFKNKIKINRNDYKELKIVNDRLHNDLFQQHQLIKEIYAKKEAMNDEMNELKRIKPELQQENNALKKEIGTLEGTIVSKTKDVEQQKNALVMKIQELQTKLDVCESNQEIHLRTTQKQEEQLKQLKDELNETQTDRDQYCNDKQSMQSEMTLLNKQLDEVKTSKTRLESEMVQFSERMDDSLQRTARQQQRIEELELTKNKLEQSNGDQMKQIQNMELTFKLQLSQLQSMMKKKETEINEWLDTITRLKEEKAATIIHLNEKFDEKMKMKDGIIQEINSQMEGLRKGIEVCKNHSRHLIECKNQEIHAIKSQKDEECFDAVHNLQKVIENQQRELHENKQCLEAIEELNVKISSVQEEKRFIQSTNTDQYDEIIKLKEINDSLKKQMIRCDAHIIKLKDCIISKFEDLNKAYAQKMDETKRVNNTIRRFEYELKEKEMEIQQLKESIHQNEFEHKYDDILSKFTDLNAKYAQTIHELNELQQRQEQSEQSMKLHNALQTKHDVLQDQKMNDLKNKVISKKECIESLYIKMNEMECQYKEETAATHCKLDVLSMVMTNKLNSFTEIAQNKDAEIEELCIKCINLRQEMALRRTRVMALEDEIEVLKDNKSSLEVDISDLNRNLFLSHSKHRLAKQSLDEAYKSNQQLQHTDKEMKKELSNTQQELASMKHESEQLYRHGDHLKERCDDFECRYRRYKNKFKSAQTECVLLRKKTSVLDQLQRLTDDEMGQLQFNNTKRNVGERLMCDQIEREYGNDCALHKAYYVLMEIKNMENDDKDYGNGYDDDEYDDMKQRMDDLKAECNHYKQILKLDDGNNMDFIQETALYTHQIFGDWQKIINTLTMKIDIKSNTIHGLQKTVSDMTWMKGKDEDLRKRNTILILNINEMERRIQVLETDHGHEIADLKSLLNRESVEKDVLRKELNAYNSKMQLLNEKYCISCNSQEHASTQNDLIYKGDNRDYTSHQDPFDETIYNDGDAITDDDICSNCHQPGSFNQISSEFGRICIKCMKLMSSTNQMNQ